MPKKDNETHMKFRVEIFFLIIFDMSYNFPYTLKTFMCKYVGLCEKYFANSNPRSHRPSERRQFKPRLL
jgi:hypothetical protein